MWLLAWRPLAQEDRVPDPAEAPPPNPRSPRDPTGSRPPPPAPSVPCSGVHSGLLEGGPQAALRGLLGSPQALQGSRLVRGGRFLLPLSTVSSFPGGGWFFLGIVEQRNGTLSPGKETQRAGKVILECRGLVPHAQAALLPGEQLAGRGPVTATGSLQLVHSVPTLKKLEISPADLDLQLLQKFRDRLGIWPTGLTLLRGGRELPPIPAGMALALCSSLPGPGKRPTGPCPHPATSCFSPALLGPDSPLSK